MASTFKSNANFNSASANGIETKALDARQVGKLNQVTTDYLGFPICLSYDVVSDASGSGLVLFNANFPYKFKIISVIVECLASNASGTITLYNGSNAITDAIACDTIDVIAKAGTINDTYSTIAVNGTLKVIANGASDTGRITLIGLKIS